MGGAYHEDAVARRAKEPPILKSRGLSSDFLAKKLNVTKCSMKIRDEVPYPESARVSAKRSERGASLVEYALLIALIANLAILQVSAITWANRVRFCQTSAAMKSPLPPYTTHLSPQAFNNIARFGSYRNRSSRIRNLYDNVLRTRYGC